VQRPAVAVAVWNEHPKHAVEDESCCNRAVKTDYVGFLVYLNLDLWSFEHAKCKNHPEKVANFSPLSTRSDQVTMTDPDQKDDRMERGFFWWPAMYQWGFLREKLDWRNSAWKISYQWKTPYSKGMSKWICWNITVWDSFSTAVCAKKSNTCQNAIIVLLHWGPFGEITSNRHLRYAVYGLIAGWHIYVRFVDSILVSPVHDNANPCRACFVLPAHFGFQLC